MAPEHHRTRSTSGWSSKVDPQPGQTILDVAAGTGDLGFLAAERVGEGGKVLCTDFSPEMLEAARRNGEARGLSNVEYRVLDAEHMDLDDDSVDGVVSRWGYMLMADPAAALRETRRVLRDGGTLAFAVWQTPDRNPWAALPGMTLVQRGHMPPPEPGAPGIFAHGGRRPHPRACHGRRLRRAQGRGADVRVALRRRRPLGHAHPSGRPARAVIKELSDDERQATRAAIEEGLEQYRQDGELVVPAACWGVVAR